MQDGRVFEPIFKVGQDRCKQYNGPYIVKTLQRPIKCRMISAELRKHLIFWANHTTWKTPCQWEEFVSLSTSTALGFVPHAIALHSFFPYSVFSPKEQKSCSASRDYIENIFTQFISYYGSISQVVDFAFFLKERIQILFKVIMCAAK